MKISDLIAKLQELQAAYGDLPVYYLDFLGIADLDALAEEPVDMVEFRKHEEWRQRSKLIVYPNRVTLI